MSRLFIGRNLDPKEDVYIDASLSRAILICGKRGSADSEAESSRLPLLGAETDRQQASDFGRLRRDGPAPGAAGVFEASQERGMPDAERMPALLVVDEEIHEVDIIATIMDKGEAKLDDLKKLLDVPPIMAVRTIKQLAVKGILNLDENSGRVTLP